MAQQGERKKKLRGGFFAAWGRLMYRRRIIVLCCSAVLLVLSLVAVIRGGTLVGVITADFESQRAATLLEHELPRPGRTSFQLLFQHATRSGMEPAFRESVQRALAPLRADPHVTLIRTPYEQAGNLGLAMLSRDGHSVVVEVFLRDEMRVAGEYYPALRRQVRSSELTIEATGELATKLDFDRVLEQDLQRAELLSVPLTIFVLLAVFGSLVAALLPVGVGLLAVMGGTAALLTLTHYTDVSPYALNVVTLIGLGVAIDYSLFIVNRFREELAAGVDVASAVERTVATAGRAVAFSGVAVAVGLSGLLFYRGIYLDIMGITGAIVVALAVLYALSFLPALLGVLGHNVDRLKVPLPQLGPSDGGWHRLASAVMKHPIMVLVPTLALLLAAGSPFLDLRTANSDVTVLPERVEARHGFDRLLNDFPGQDPQPVVAVVRFNAGTPLSPERVQELWRFGMLLRGLPHVERVDSLFTTGQPVPPAMMAQLLSMPREMMPVELRSGIASSVGQHVVVFSVRSDRAPMADETRTIVRAIRLQHRVADGDVLVTGQCAYDLDMFDYIIARTPYAVGLVMAMTFLVLFFALGSIILPIKAVLMNLLSITASFGALVWIFQKGHLHTVLHFRPGPVEHVLPVLLFCIVFGLSMDYEVLLLSRMQEEYERTGDNRQAVAEGLERSARLITSAALIMVVVFSAFAMASVVVIKALGLGMALAVALDATIVRILIVPATMRLFGDLNWWAPGPLKALYRKFGLGHH